MSFAKHAIMSVGLCACGFSLLPSCDADMRSRKDIAEEKEREAENAQTQKMLDITREALAEERKRKEREEEEEAQAKLAKQEELRRLEEEKKKQEEEQRKAEEEAKLAELELKEAKRQEELRVQACEQMKGKKYETLTLANGETLENLKVTSADAIGITIMYKHGIKRIPYTNLPEEICEACRYDPDAAKRRKQIEDKIRIAQNKARQRAAELERQRKIRNKELTSLGGGASSSDTPSADSSLKEVKPRGNVTVTLAGINTRDPGYIRGQKKLRIRAIANVLSYVEMDGVRVGVVRPNQTLEIEKITSPTGKYTVSLWTESGTLLDKEKHNRKTGLTTGGL